MRNMVIIFLSIPMVIMLGFVVWKGFDTDAKLQSRSSDDVASAYTEAIKNHDPRILDSFLKNIPSQSTSRAEQSIRKYDGINITNAYFIPKKTESSYSLNYDIYIEGYDNTNKKVNMNDTILVQKLQYWDNIPLIDELFTRYSWFLAI